METFGLAPAQINRGQGAALADVLRGRALAPFRAAAPALLVLVAGGLGVPGFAEGAQAQQQRPSIDVIGTVSDAASDHPLPGILVRMVPQPLLDEEGRPVEEERTRSTRETVTDPAGRFHFPGVIPGRYRLEVGALGYSSITQDVGILGASPFEIRVGLVPEALELAPVVVTSIRSPRLTSSGFYDRRTRGIGNFMDRYQMEDRPVLRTSDLFNFFPGVQLRPARIGSGSILTIRGGCRPDLVIDGMNLGPNVLIDDIVTPSDVEAIEVYRGGTSPIEYSRSNCGSVLLWTADPAIRPEAAPFTYNRLFAAAGFVIGFLLLTR
jgi:hypothetical protein